MRRAARHTAFRDRRSLAAAIYLEAVHALLRSDPPRSKAICGSLEKRCDLCEDAAGAAKRVLMKNC